MMPEIIIEYKWAIYGALLFLLVVYAMCGGFIDD